MSSNDQLHQSPWLKVCALTLGIALAAGALGVWVGGSDGARLAIRFTARTSLLLFLMTFTAAALFRFWPGRITQWMRRNRRYIGVSFAGSHAVHALAIVAFIRINPTAFHAAVPPIGLLLNGIGYAFIIAMTATSFDRTAAWMGPKAWRWLHLIGAYYIWFAFAKSYFPRTVHSSFYLPAAIFLSLALGIRLAGLFWKSAPARMIPALASAAARPQQ